MNVLDISDKFNSFTVMGDIHGNFNLLFNKLKHGYKNTVIIIAGDCGFGFHKPTYYIQELKKLDTFCGKNKILLLMVRGNHDDPSYFTEDKLHFINIKCIPDYTVVKVGKNSVLCIGGAISVDRSWRIAEEIRINRYSTNTKKKLYWADENVVYDETKLQEIEDSGIKINHVISHSSPSIAYPNIKNIAIEWMRSDETLQEDIKIERANLTKIYQFLKSHNHPLEHWIHGHFHQTHHEEIDGVGFESLDDNIHAFISKGEETQPKIVLDWGHNVSYTLRDVTPLYGMF